MSVSRRAGSLEAHDHSERSQRRLTALRSETWLPLEQNSGTVAHAEPSWQTNSRKVCLGDVLNFSTENLRSCDSCFFTKQKHHILPVLLKPALTQTRAACLFLSQQKTPCTAPLFPRTKFGKAVEHLVLKSQLCFNFETAHCVCMGVNAARLNLGIKVRLGVRFLLQYDTVLLCMLILTGKEIL